MAAPSETDYYWLSREPAIFPASLRWTLSCSDLYEIWVDKESRTLCDLQSSSLKRVFLLLKSILEHKNKFGASVVLVSVIITVLGAYYMPHLMNT